MSPHLWLKGPNKGSDEVKRRGDRTHGNQTKAYCDIMKNKTKSLCDLSKPRGNMDFSKN